MRLILCPEIFDLPKSHEFPDDAVAFFCFEDFSVGPLGNWRNPSEFKKSRAAFWQNSTIFDLPDGSKMPYSAWMQFLPRYDLVEMIRSGVYTDDVPVSRDFEEVAAQATTIEIWRDRTASGEVLQWYLSAMLPILGVDLGRVSVCLFTHPISRKQPNAFWSDMLSDAPDRGVPALRPSPSDWQHMSMCWDAITHLPDPIDAFLLETPDDHALHALEMMKGRFPDVVTGLTNIQARLLRAAADDWRKMIRTLSDAMIAGDDAHDAIRLYSLEASLNEMVQMPDPLIEKRGEGPIRNCEVRLTSLGQRKLSLIGDRL
ncbi:hypothetical protein ACOXXX_04335 [Thalassococcus sp. BH17M4-6]|uniref:hypothetical protein n=1 Tax=Thalassococcus sp. BH17M4-6 TaxID=3413148 RepID=UPI003BCE2766